MRTEIHKAHKKWPKQDPNAIRYYAIAFYDANDELDAIELNTHDYGEAMRLAVLFCGVDDAPGCLIFKDVKILA